MNTLLNNTITRLKQGLLIGIGLTSMGLSVFAIGTVIGRLIS